MSIFRSRWSTGKFSLSSPDLTTPSRFSRLSFPFLRSRTRSSKRYESFFGTNSFSDENTQSPSPSDGPNGNGSSCTDNSSATLRARKSCLKLPRSGPDGLEPHRSASGRRVRFSDVGDFETNCATSPRCDENQNSGDHVPLSHPYCSTDILELFPKPPSVYKSVPLAPMGDSSSKVTHNPSQNTSQNTSRHTSDDVSPLSPPPPTLPPKDEIYTPKSALSTEPTMAIDLENADHTSTWKNQSTGCDPMQTLLPCKSFAHKRYSSISVRSHTVLPPPSSPPSYPIPPVPSLPKAFSRTTGSEPLRPPLSPIPLNSERSVPRIISDEAHPPNIQILPPSESDETSPVPVQGDSKNTGPIDPLLLVRPPRKTRRSKRKSPSRSGSTYSLPKECERDYSRTKAKVSKMPSSKPHVVSSPKVQLRSSLKNTVHSPMTTRPLSDASNLSDLITRQKSLNKSFGSAPNTGEFGVKFSAHNRMGSSEIGRFECKDYTYFVQEDAMGVSWGRMQLRQ
ncbi:hypothetical protein K439DRAFT_277666 [Ramaria rubella]|nr:hypothetical protein K439DRAFT_277666 [Ramaria rubella]